MRFHLPSFMLGYGAGAVSVLAGKRLRPFLVEVATAVYGLVESVGARIATQREDLEDVLAEARERARSRVRADRTTATTAPGVVGHA